MLGDAGVERFELEELLVSYRVPDDFLRLAAPLRAGGAAVPEGVRAAPWPAVAVRTDAGGLGAACAALAARMAAEAGSVGVVVPAALRPELDAALAGVAATAAEDAEGGLSGGVDLLGLRAIKGLEFDAAHRRGAGGDPRRAPRRRRAAASTRRSPAPPARSPSCTRTPLPPALASAPELAPRRRGGRRRTAWSAGRGAGWPNATSTSFEATELRLEARSRARRDELERRARRRRHPAVAPRARSVLPAAGAAAFVAAARARAAATSAGGPRGRRRSSLAARVRAARAASRRGSPAAAASLEALAWALGTVCIEVVLVFAVGFLALGYGPR